MGHHYLARRLADEKCHNSTQTSTITHPEDIGIISLPHVSQVSIMEIASFTLSPTERFSLRPVHAGRITSPREDMPTLLQRKFAQSHNTLRRSLSHSLDTWSTVMALDPFDDSDSEPVDEREKYECGKLGLRSLFSVSEVLTLV